MQEKISQAPPPEIKLFEGKPPPTSWVNENIVRYFQIKSETEFLKDIVTYAQELQSENLAKTRPAATPIREAFAAFPEEESAEALSTVALFNSSQSYLKAEMEHLEKLIQLMKNGNAELSPRYNQALTDFQALVRKFPNLSADNINYLNKLMQELLEDANKLPVRYRKAFWSQMLKMLQELMAANGANIKDFQSALKEISMRSQLLHDLQDLLQEIRGALNARPPTSKEFLQLLESLQRLANSNTFLNNEQNQVLTSFFQQLNQFKTKTGQNLTQFAAESIVQTKMSEFIKAKPNATLAEILEHLTQFLKESNLQSSKLPFMQSLGDEIEEILNQKGFPATTGATGLPFAKVVGEKIVPNEGMVDALLTNYSPNDESVAALDKSSGELGSAFEEEVEGNAEKIEGYNITLTQLKSFQNNFGKGALWVVGQSIATGRPSPKMGSEFASPPPPGAAAPGAEQGGPLPWQFEKAILGHYMPGQEAYLESLAMFLYMDNTGAEFGNVLLTKILSFGQAADNYDFSNFLHSSSKGNFSGMSYTAAKNQLSNERNQCNNDINNCNDALNSIYSQLAEIQNELNTPGLSPELKAKYTEMKNKLTEIEGQIKASLVQLQTLQYTLAHIQITPPTGNYSKSKYFSVKASPPLTSKDWQGELSKQEGQVVNGDPTAKPPAYKGGLVNVQADVQNFQQFYSDQGQNMQMILQMRMTEIQQEWTVVATALQLLNQIYMSLAQGIYK